MSEEPTAHDPRTDEPDSRTEPSIEEELRNLGRRFADVLHAAWSSEERRKVETGMREGLRHFSEEVDRLYERTRESPAGERVRTKFGEAQGRASDSETAHRTRETLAQGLRRLSEELARLADRFTPAAPESGTTEGQPPDDPAY